MTGAKHQAMVLVHAGSPRARDFGFANNDRRMQLCGLNTIDLWSAP
jgi:hypothetical protein